VARVVAENHPVPMRFVAIRDRYARSGKPDELLETCGLTAASIAAAVRELSALK
jgi:transketolase